MKQITMDYETYENEIAQARKEGTKVRLALFNELKKTLDKLNDYDRRDFYSAKNKVYDILAELRVE